MATLIRWRNAVFALFLVNGLVSGVWAARLPAVKADTQASLQELGLALLCAAIGVIIGLSLGPVLLDRLGVRRALALAYGSTIASLVAAGFASSILQSIWLVGLGAFAWGLSIGAADVVTNIEAAANEREIGKTLMPLMHAFFSIGALLGALTGWAAALAGLSVLVHFALAAGACAALLARAVPGVPQRADVALEAESRTNKHRINEALRAWRDPVLLLVGVGALANGLAEGGAGDWLAVAAVDGHDLTQASGALLYGGFVAGMTLMRLLGGPIVDRWGRVTVLRASAISALVGVSVFVWTDGFWLLLAGCILWGLGVALGFPLAFSAAADHPEGPTRVSVVSTLGYGAFLVGPPLLGFIGEQTGILVAIATLLVVLAGAALAASATRERSSELSPAS